ncbi:unnamed protein product [Adineta steineri]|uniref:Uncharacterized protein n=1 Tax=Adineta steineri TaxID=433720 RepID=A0A815E2Z3_9BILA|nr:unnamed protein product [Adineta steineri]CAF1301416.1 unnamed protein product [Adineta steineri]
MKFLVEERIYPLRNNNNNNQEQNDFINKNQSSDDKDPSSSIEALQNVLANKFYPNHNSTKFLKNYFNSSINEKQFNHICSSLSKRIETYSLSNHSTMAITATTNFSEEQTNTIEYDNTYLSSEEITRLDDISSLTTITSNLSKEFSFEQNTSVYLDTTICNSDIDEISEEMTSDIKQYNYNNMNFDLQNSNVKNKDEEIIQIHRNQTPTNNSFTGVAHAVKYTIIKENNEQTLSDYDNVSHRSKYNSKIRSHADIVSVNSSMTSTIQYNHCPMMLYGEQLNKQERTSTSEDNDDYYYDDDDDYIIIDQQNPIVQLTMMNNESEIELEEDDDDEYYQEIDSRRLFDNEQLNGYISDDIRYSSDVIRNNHTSSTLRQEAISITKVRCKQRNTWLHSSTSLENNSTNLIKPLLSKNLDALSTSKKTDNFYLIHHQSSLIPIKDLLNHNINKNIEIIQMDEQECILEIVDGVVTLVPKDKSSLLATTTATTDSDEDKSEEKQKNSIEYETSNNYDSPKHTERSSSVNSSISTPSLSEHEPEQDEISSSSSSSSRSSSNKDENEETQEPFILLRDTPSRSPPIHSQTEQSVDLLDLFSTPPIPISNSSTDKNNNKSTKNLLDDSLSSVSSYKNKNPDNDSNTDSSDLEEIRSSSPLVQEQDQEQEQEQEQVKSLSPSISEKDDFSPESPTHQISVPSESIPIVEKSPSVDETDVEYQLPKSEPPPAAKPINKARINEFASLLSGSVHLIQPPAIKKQETPKSSIPFANRPPTSPSRSDEQSYSSIRSANSDRDERESFHTVQSNNNSDQEQTKKSIDARYNEKIDDRKSIQINTSNIKALFEQKISDTNKALSQSNEHLLHTIEAKQQQQHKKAPISYGSLKRNLLSNQPQQQTTRRQSYQDISNMNKYTDHIAGVKDVVIEDKQPEHEHQPQIYGSNTRRHNTEEIIRPGTAPSRTSSESISNGHNSESLIAREIREAQEKEEELRRQRRKCGLPEDATALLTNANNDSLKTDSPSSAKAPVKSSSFLSNLDFFTSKENTSTSTNGSPSSRRSTTSITNIVYDSHVTPINDERQQINNVVSQELHRLNDNGVPIIRTGSTNNFIHRSSSNQNILAAQNTNNIIQREIEAIRAKEAELRQLGRIQHTSDEHSDPRKYQEFVPIISKSQSSNTLATGKVRRDTERIHRPVIATSNGFLTPKLTHNNNSSISSIRGKFPSPNPTAPIISSSNKSADYSKLSSTDRLELEKREFQEREQELKKQRHSAIGVTSSVNGDSGNASQDEHEEDQERYFDKIERLKRKENERAQAPLIRPTKKLDMSQRWEQMLTNKNVQNTTGDDNDED